MTHREIYERGVRDVLDLAERTAASLKTSCLRTLKADAASAALDEFAKAGRDLLLGKRPGDSGDPVLDFPRPSRPSGPSPVGAALRTIKALAGDRGVIDCPTCRGRLHWSRAPENGHVWGKCETEECVAWIQ